MMEVQNAYMEDFLFFFYTKSRSLKDLSFLS